MYLIVYFLKEQFIFLYIYILEDLSLYSTFFIICSVHKFFFAKLLISIISNLLFKERSI